MPMQGDEEDCIVTNRQVPAVPLSYSAFALAFIAVILECAQATYYSDSAFGPGLLVAQANECSCHNVGSVALLSCYYITACEESSCSAATGKGDKADCMTDHSPTSSHSHYSIYRLSPAVKDFLAGDKHQQLSHPELSISDPASAV